MLPLLVMVLVCGVMPMAYQDVGNAVLCDGGEGGGCCTVVVSVGIVSKGIWCEIAEMSPVGVRYADGDAHTIGHQAHMIMDIEDQDHVHVLFGPSFTTAAI